ncbi:hypothetical protein [Marinigracilibium pacificum]|uniref:4-vinyl reductase 4VR domain-containing protein n=1 Tax=Marinigracilibium pacificum TaxID=2729599 RepID=A0A848IXJ0_9BACT|nr:hypothetical protein [Marinigracilibium pacificum]NMM49017.1 hypothetical protein [Marinigracilibium pacificum]
MSDTFSQIIQDKRINEEQNISHLTEPVIVIDNAWFSVTEKLIESTGKQDEINKRLFYYASELSRNMFVKYFNDKEFSFSEKKFIISRYIKDSGLGNIDLSSISKTGGEVITTSLCKSTGDFMPFQNPYAMGVLCGALGAAYELGEEETFVSQKLSCKNTGDTYCLYNIELVAEENPFCYKSPEWGNFQIAQTTGHDNEFGIISETVISMPFYGDHNGEIHILNNKLTKTFSNYIALFPFLVAEVATQDLEGVPLNKKYVRQISDLFIHFFEHLYRSTEWKGLTDKLIHRNQDMADCLLAFINALGYGRIIRDSYKDNTELIVTIENNFESNSQIGSVKTENRTEDYLFTRGLLSGITRFIQSKKDQKKLFKLNGIGLKKFGSEVLHSRINGDDIDQIRVYAK